MLVKSRKSRLIVAGLFVLLLSFVPAAPGSAVEVVVTNTADSGPGSLRQALLDTEEGGTITFSTSGVITLASGPLMVTREVTIEGPGAEQLTVSGNNSSSVFHISQVSADISGLTIAGGHDNSGGGIYVSNGSLTLTGCEITSNGSDTYGAAINSSNSNLTLTDCLIADNETVNYSDGGAMYVNGGSLAMTDCEVSGNSSLGSGTGISGRGGALYINVPTVTLTRCFFSENTGADGGAIYADSVASLTVESCLFSGNSALTRGGAIYSRGSSVRAENSTFGANLAIEGAGAYFTEGSSLSMMNCTLCGNIAQGIPDGMAGNGGGIYGNGGSLSLTNCTFGGNNATSAGSGVYVWFGTLNLKNTILAGNEGTCDLFSGHDFGAAPNSHGFNLIGTTIAGGSSSWVWQDTDIVSSDIVFADIFDGPLADNGGLEAGVPGDTVVIPTLALFEGSLAEDAGSSTGFDGVRVIFADQRGVSRPQGGSSDIGAFELEKLDGDDTDPTGGNSGCNAAAFTPSLAMLFVPLLLLIGKRR